MGIVDPHRQCVCVKDETQPAGEKKRLGEFFKHEGHKACFDGIFGMSSEQTDYNATLFRFPLRQDGMRQDGTVSKISSTTYNPEKVIENLFSSLKEEGPIILLFLKNVTSISVYKWDGKATLLFGVEVDAESKQALQTERKQSKTLAENYSLSSSHAEVQLFTATFLQTLAEREAKKIHWLVLSVIGSSNMALKKLGKELKVLPWVAIAASLPEHIHLPQDCSFSASAITEPNILLQELSPFLRQLHHSQLTLPLSHEDAGSVSGQAFCFLPLPGCTALPVNVHGYFSVADNRRSIKWPAHDDKGKEARWNYELLHNLVAPAYSILLACRSSLLQYQGTPPVQNTRHITDPYAAWPVYREVKNQSIWSDLVEPTLKLASEFPLVWTQADRGKWVKLSDAYFLPGSFSSAPQLLPPALAIEALIYAGIPVVSFPSALCETLQSHETLLKIVVDHEVTPPLVRKALRKHKEFLQSKSTMKDQNSMYALLDYILSDSDLSEKDLVGIPLLPLKSDKLSFCQFEDPLQANSKYIFTSNLKEVLQLLPGVDSMIVSTEIPPGLEKKLVMLAEHGQLQLKLATPENICSTILKQSIFSWCKQRKCPSVWGWTPGCSNHPPLEWIRGVWNWLTSKSVPLPLLEGLPLIPQSLPQDSVHTKVTISLIEITKTISLTIIPFHQPAVLVGILEQLGFTIVERSVCFAHPGMNRYIPTLNPALVAQQIYSHKKASTVHSFSNEQKDALRQYLASGSIPSQYRQCLSSLPIFKAGIGKSEVKYVPLDPQRHILLPAKLTLPTNPCYPDYILSREDYPSIQLIKTLGQIPELSVERFCVEHLIPYACFLQQRCLDGDDIAKWLLSQQPYLPRPVISCLKESKFIRTLSYLKSPSELYDPHNETFQELFDSKTEPVFPAEQYDPYVGNLRKLGLITWNSVVHNVDQLCSLIQSRVRTVATLFKNDVQAALQRSKTILKILMQYFPDRLWNAVHHVPFLFAQSTPPPFYPSHLPWYGQSLHCLETADKLCLPVHQNELLVGSVKPFLSCEYEAIRGYIATRFCQIHAGDVIRHLSNLVTAVKAEKVVEYSSISQVVSIIYRFLSTVPFPEQSLPSCWIWWESVKEFLPVTSVVLKLPQGIDLEPYIFSISKNLHLSQFKSLFKQCNIKKSIETEDVVQILHKIQATCKSTARSLTGSEPELKMVLDILNWLKETSESPGNILIPTSDGFLLPSIQCTFDDRDWIKQKKNLLQISHFTFVHEKVDAPLARYFQVKPLSEKIAPSEKLCIKYTLAGQHERVTRRIRHIVQDYETNIDIFKELIQNADDAGATEVKFLIDWRKHPSSSLFSGDLQPWQGPALIAYNNATFSDPDFQHICQLAGETKRSNPLKTGRFGVGFCAVYQLTDLPSFISRRYFTMFDPHTIYLGDRVSPREPGMRIDLVESQRDLKVYEDQFMPYQNIFGCNIFDLPEGGYNGTLFRFPFRDIVTAGNSEICRKIYTKRELERLEKALQNRATELLLFLKHVERVSLFYLDEHATNHAEMKEVLSIKKSACQNVCTAHLQSHKSNARTSLIQDYLHNPSYQGTKKSSLKIEVSSKTSGCSQSQWLLCSTLQSSSSTLDILKLEGKQTGLVPLAEVAVNIDMVSGGIIPKGVEGLTFCFLPLPVKSGLQFHINGFFDVGKDRRSLSAADDETFGSRWNKALGQSALTEAFNQLLATLASRTNLKEIKDTNLKKDILNSYYSLWNLKKSTGIVPQALVSSFGKQLMATELEILWSEVNGGCWICPKEAIIFSEYLLKSEVCKDAIEVMIQERYKIVEPPSQSYHVMMMIKKGLQEKKAVYTYHRFCEEVLFPNVITVDPSLRDKHLLYLLEKVGQEHHEYKWANKLLQKNHCIPCQESSELLHPDQLIDCTQPHLKCLYSPSEGRFPSDCLLKSSRAMYGLALLGMARYKLKLTDLHERATSVCELMPHEATERSHHILEYLQKTYSSYTFTTVTLTDELKQVRETLRDVAFLLPLKKPEGIDIPWYTKHGYITPSESLHPKYKNLTFTQKPVVELPPTLTHGYQVLDCLGVGESAPNLELVIQHLHCLVSSLTEVEISDATRSHLNNEKVMYDVYKYLEHKLKWDSDGVAANLIKHRLQGLSFIWQDGHFLSVNQVVKVWHHQCYPYMCELSSTNRTFDRLFSLLGVREKATVEVLAQILKQIKDDHGPDSPVSDDIIPFIEKILQEVVSQLKLHKECSEDFYLPDENKVMRPASQLASQKIGSDLAGWLAESEAYKAHFDTGSGHFVHPSIPIKRAEALGARPLLDAILKDIEDESFLDGSDYGQYEELCDRLNSILKKYPADESMFQEFIQNADDAQASEIVFVLDHRTDFQDKKLFGHGKNWAKLQHTPALCIFNNRKFSEADIQGLAKLGRGGKDQSGDKIGKFGIGFNVAYHITDCPTFLSYGEGGLPENFCVLDPTCEFAPKASNKRSPGRRWKVTSKHIEEFADQFEPFLANDLPKLSKCAPNCLRNFSENGFVVFRLPLTRKLEIFYKHPDACTQIFPRHSYTGDQHRNKLKGTTFSVDNLSKLLKSLSSKAKDILVYLNHLQQISVFEINKDGKCTHNSTTTANISALHLQAYKQFASYTSDCLQQIREGKCPATKSTCHEVNILHVERQDGENGEFSPVDTTWLVQRAVGSNQLDLGLLQSALQHGLKPVGGVAAQLSLEHRQYHIFCFLPLPLDSHLPVHVNGHFLVDDSRKHFEEIKHEGLSEWNKEIATKVIAHAYVDLVLQAMDMVPLTGSSKWFYNLFPKLEIPGELGDLKLPEAFYAQLLLKNPPVLMPQQSPLVHGTANPQVELQWFQLKSGYFCTEVACKRTEKIAVVSTKLRDVLVALGMPLTSAPLLIHWSCSKIDEKYGELARIDPQKVIKHLQQATFCDSTEVLLRQNIEHLLAYCSKGYSDKEFPSVLQTVPLLLASDGSLQRSSQMYESRFTALLPGLAERFIDPNLERSEVGKHLFQCKVIVPLPIEVVAQHIELPDTMSPIPMSSESNTMEIVRNLWEYLSEYSWTNDSILHYFHCKAIIPTMDERLFPISLCKAVINTVVGDSDVQNVLRKLGCPLLDCDQQKGMKVFQSVTTSCSSPEDVIECLSLQLTLNYEAELNAEEVHAFIECIRKSKFTMKPEVTRIFSRLRLFQTTDGSFVSLDSAHSGIFIIPPKMPMNGIDKIQKHTNAVILKHPDKYTQAFYRAIVPRYSEAVISLSEFYVRLIIPNIEHLGDAAIIVHLQFIKHNQEHPDMQCVLDALRKARFIHLNGSYRPPSELYDPEVDFFKTFYCTELPPAPWNSQKWLPFLRDVGLKKKITKSKWLLQANRVASSRHSSIVLMKQSQVLLAALISKIKAISEEEQAPEKVHAVTAFLHNVADIHFICPSMPLHINELLAGISPPLRTQQLKQNSLICFRDSIFLADADLAWLHKSVLPRDCDELRSSKMRKDGLQIEFPLRTETVVQNLSLLSEVVSRSCAQQPKSTNQIEQMVKLFTAHYAFLNMKKKLTDTDLEPLMDKAILLLNTEDSPVSSPITLVKRTQLAKHIPGECSLEPFCYRMPPHLLKYDHFMKVLSICDELKAFQYAKILNSINDGIVESGMELKSNDQYMKVTEGAYNQLIRCLRRGDGTLTGRINVSLLTDQHELQDSSKLYYDDVPWYAKRIPAQSCANFEFIKQPPADDRGRTIPPVSLGVRLLSTVISEKLHEDVKSPDFNCTDEELYTVKKRTTRCGYVQKLLDTFTSIELLNGLCRVYWSENKSVPTQEFLIAAKILAQVEIKCIAHEPLKTVLCQNGKPIPGTEGKAFCHMEMQSGKNILYISPHIDDFTEESFLKQLAFAVRKVLHGEIKNDMHIVAMFKCDPHSISRALDDERVEPYNPNELEKVTYHDIGDTVQLDTLTHHDLLIILNFSAGELVLFHSADGTMRYCEIVEVKQSHKVFEPSVQIRTLQVTNSSDDTEDTEEEVKLWVTPLQLYKCLTPHQRAALFLKQPVVSMFATPIILADVPCSDLDSLYTWLGEIYHSLEIQSLSGLDISLLAIRLVGHLHYQLVIQDRAQHLFGPAVMEIQRLTCCTELPCCTVDEHHQLVKTLDKLAGRFERMCLEEGVEEEEATRSFRVQLAGRFEQMCLEEGVESEEATRYSSTSDSDDDAQQLSYRYPYSRQRHPLRSQQTQSRQIHHTPPPPVAQLTPPQYPQQRFPTMSRRRGCRPPQQTRFQPVPETPTQPPKPPICIESSRMWLDQAKADYRAAEFLLESMGDVDSMEVEVQNEATSTDQVSEASSIHHPKETSRPEPDTTDQPEQVPTVEQQDESSSIGSQDEMSSTEQQDEQEESAGAHHFPALVCFLCHETVEKCLKGVHYAFCGLRPNMIDSSHLVELLESLKQSPHSPKALIPALQDCVYLINEHENKSRLPNYQIPPCAPAAVYNHMDAIEAFFATRRLLAELQKDEKLKDLFGCIGEIPKPKFVSTLKSMATGESKLVHSIEKSEHCNSYQIKSHIQLHSVQQ